MNSKQSLENLKSKKNKARAGENWTINNKRISGHIGNIAKRKKNGTIEVVVYTHAKRSFGKKNIRLNENPNPNDEKDAYVVRELQNAKIKHLGKKHDDIKIKNSRDKSIIRKIKSQKKRQDDRN